MKRNSKSGSMKNSNLIHIALDYHKQERRKRIARLLNQVTLLCKDKGIKWHADINSHIEEHGKKFPCTESGLRQARDFVLNIEQKKLNDW